MASCTDDRRPVADPTFPAAPFCRADLELKYLAVANALLRRNDTSSNVSSGLHLEINKDGIQDSSPVSLNWFPVVLPVLCTLGVFGNIINLCVLTRKRFYTPMGKLERTSNQGLIVLAFSDMMFCISVFPLTFIPHGRNLDAVSQREVFILYYKIYGVSLINLFMNISIWLTVVLAVERYIVLYFPLKAKWMLSLKKNKLILLCICCLALLVSFPYFFATKVRGCFSLNGAQRYETVPFSRDHSSPDFVIKMYIRHVWPAIAVFVPLCVLLFCNVRLIQGLRRVPSTRRKKCPGQNVRDVNTRITLTLIIIVAMALIFVTPSEVMKIINPYKMWGDSVGHTVAAVANLLQTFNFAFNFVLYCAIDRNFRQICRNLLLRNACRSRRFGRSGVRTEVIFVYRQGTPTTTPPRLKPATKSSSKSEKEERYT